MHSEGENSDSREPKNDKNWEKKSEIKNSLLIYFLSHKMREGGKITILTLTQVRSNSPQEGQCRCILTKGP